MSNVEFQRPASVVLASQNENPREVRLEAREIHKYLLAKSYFDCREYDRCAAVFLPMTLPKGELSESNPTKGKEKMKAGSATPENREVSIAGGFPDLSNRALFLALYAKYMAGEKRRDEESETILGPSDGGATVNRELVGISQVLEARVNLQTSRSEHGQGWLEYLYGIVLAKGKNDELAKSFLIKSVEIYPFNWGAWQELNSLIGSTDEV